jgi:hypothetical protein
VHVRIEDAFATTPSHYWDMFFSEDYNRGLWPALDIGWQLVRLERSGAGDELVIQREQILTPRRELPGFMRRFVQDALTYREFNVFEARYGSMQVRTVPNVLADRLTSVGTYSVRAGNSGVVRVFEGDVECAIPLVGGRIAAQIVEEIRESYRKTTAFTREWLAAHPAA